MAFRRVVCAAAAVAVTAVALAVPATHAAPMRLARPAADAWKPTQCGPGNIMTKFGQEVTPGSVLPEYPRPQQVRGGGSRDSTAGAGPAAEPEAEGWLNLNGLWEHQEASPGEAPPVGKTLNGSILVPFPVESCLSGVGANMEYQWYRLTWAGGAPFPAAHATGGRTLLHFGAVDWNATVWVNGKQVGTHSGGYDGFSFDITAELSAEAHGSNELIVLAYDPSDTGYQVNGKQRVSAIKKPGGDTYTPSSGIWQTVWLESVPQVYLAGLKIVADSAQVTVTAAVAGAPEVQLAGATVSIAVMDNGATVATGSGNAGQAISVKVPQPKMWSPASPFLYNMTVSLNGGADTLDAYFGMRTFGLGDFHHPPIPGTGIQQGIDRAGQDLPGMPIKVSSSDPHVCWGMCNKTKGCVAWASNVPGCDQYKDALCWLKGSVPGTSNNKCRASGALGVPGTVTKRPFLNGAFQFMAGWLDQSFWPDGLYTAPTDAGLAFDVAAVPRFGLNMIRLHQKVNSERWYWTADKLGVIVWQDMPQKYGGATAATVAPFLSDLHALIQGPRANHPCIVQWETFNEGDCVAKFNASAIVELAESLDPSRLVDTDSGGPANNLHIGSVNDIHDYPDPQDPKPSSTQYAAIGEFGGLGAFVKGHEWSPGGCYAYKPSSSPSDQANTYIAMTSTIMSRAADISATVYTQITDVERECDGFLNYDRTDKFTGGDVARIAAANRKLTQLK